jgi:hypothetical protein
MKASAATLSSSAAMARRTAVTVLDRERAECLDLAPAAESKASAMSAQAVLGRWRSGSGRPTRVGGETMHPCSRIPPS